MTSSALGKLKLKTQDESRYGKIVHEGFLNKRSKGKSWRNCYAVLWEDMGLRFYESESRGNAEGKIKMSKINEIKKLSSSQSQQLDSNNPYFFAITSTQLSKTWHFGCNNDEILSKWVHILQASLALGNKKKKKPSPKKVEVEIEVQETQPQSPENKYIGHIEMSDKKEATDADKEEDLSILLRQLYRLTYEAIENDENGQGLQDKYTKIIAQYETIVNKSSISKESVTSPKALINILEKLILYASSKNEFIYGKKTDFKNKSDGQKENPNDPKILLLNYCSDDNIDQSMLILLKYKLTDANKSCLELCHYIQKSSGWAYCNQTAVAAVMNQINQTAWKYENNEMIQKKFPKDKKDENAKKEYISNIIVNKYQRRLLLLEIFLREKTSTSKVMYASGGYHTQIRDDSIFQMALSMDNMDVYELIFKYGVDVEGIIDNPCTTNNSTNKSSAYTMYKPIHKAVENENYTLVELLIQRGANIKDYRTDFYLDDYNISKRDRQETLLYLAATRLKDDNKMFKLILNTYKEEINGLPDVNKINMFVVTESKPKDVYDKELAAIKARIKADKAARGQTEEDDDERWGPWNNRRSEYFLRESEHVYHYETLIHVAVRECNIEMIKYLLIYGACIDDIYKIKTMISLRNSFHQQYGGRSKYTEKERAKLMKEFHDDFVEKYKKSKQLGMYECVLSVYDILENAKCDDNKKIEIKKLLQSEKRWFPELMDYYPNNMGKLLYIVGDIWCKNIPKEVTNLIIKYFYTLFTDQ